MSFNLDSAVDAEGGLPSPFAFTYQGQDFAIPLAVPMSTIRELGKVDQTDLDHIMQTLLGEEGAARFLALDPTDVVVKKLLTAYNEAKGVSLGEA
jgi:hypothetical protein